ncbi:MAG: serine/threonine protein kinase [Saprospiraceae bacterium]|nr:serine/threonine protein kinase [Saprospiraceae bacterium]
MALVTLRGTQNTYVFDDNDLIGKGGTSNVFKGREVGNNKIVAVKVLFRNLTIDDSILSRLKQEASLRFDHPNLLKIYDLIVDEESNIYHLISEYVDGENLAGLIQAARKRNNSIHFSTVKKIAFEIGSALQYLHNIQPSIIHRDVNPSNIMITTEGSAKLMDLGIARVNDPLSQSHGITRVGSIIGTYHYIPPEQINSSQYGPVGIQADIYSLGITLYESLTGELPFNGDSEYKLFQNILNTPLKEHPNISKYFFYFLQNATAKIPKDRYKDVAQFLTDLNKFKDNGSLAGELLSIKNRTTLPMYVSFASIFLLGFFFYYYNHNKVPNPPPIIIDCPKFERVTINKSILNKDTINLIQGYKKNILSLVETKNRWTYWLSNPRYFNGKVDLSGITNTDINLNNPVCLLLLKLIRETPMYSFSKELDLINNQIDWMDEIKLEKALNIDLDESKALLTKFSNEIKRNRNKFRYFVSSLEETLVSTGNLDYLLDLAQETENDKLQARAYFLKGEFNEAHNALKRLEDKKEQDRQTLLLKADLLSFNSEYVQATNQYLSILDTWSSDSLAIYELKKSHSDLDFLISKENFLFDTLFIRFVKGLKYSFDLKSDTLAMQKGKLWLECFTSSAGEIDRFKNCTSIANSRLNAIKWK